MYRNRRLGEFLKELDFTEGHSTGIPTIQEGLQRNGSPRSIIIKMIENMAQLYNRRYSCLIRLGSLNLRSYNQKIVSIILFFVIIEEV